jgi:hypothetical protein
MMLVINLATGEIYDPDMLVVIDHLDMTEKEQDIIGIGTDEQRVLDIADKYGKQLNLENK